MRRAANPTRKISITIPDSLFQKLNHILSYSQSRSAFITDAIKAKIEGKPTPTISETSTLQLMAALIAREDTEEKLKDFLLTYFS